MTTSYLPNISREIIGFDVVVEVAVAQNPTSAETAARIQCHSHGVFLFRLIYPFRHDWQFHAVPPPHGSRVSCLKQFLVCKGVDCLKAVVACGCSWWRFAVMRIFRLEQDLCFRVSRRCSRVAFWLNHCLRAGEHGEDGSHKAQWSGI